AVRRLGAARYPLVAAIFVLVLASVIWRVPLAFSLAGLAAIVLTTAISSGSPAMGNGTRAHGRIVKRWPDTSMKSIVNALDNPTFILDTSGIVRFADDAAVGEFPDTRPGDPLSLTFRSPQLAEALRGAAAGRSGHVQYRERGQRGRNFKAAIRPV